jgi:hypothetical protein
LILGGAFKDMSLPRQFNIYNNVAHIFNNNVYYIASLIALKFWYKNIRPLFASNDGFRESRNERNRDAPP